MSFRWKPLISALSATLMLASCGRAPAQNGFAADRSQGFSRAMAEDGARMQVRIQFRHRAELEALSRAGIDLFENVDNERRTVDASLSPRTEAILKAMKVSYVPLLQTQALGGRFPSGYQSVEALVADLQGVALKHPNIAKLVPIGQSLESRPIYAVRITSHPDAQLPAVRIQSGQHARELPPVEITSRLIHQLVEGYGKDAAITKLVDTRDIWVVPLVNPDGRSRVESGSAMWRKNARKDGLTSNGVDTNRNADDHFDQGSDSPRADDYHGQAPFSEPESSAIRDLCDKVHFQTSLDIHCYAGMVLWPPGFDTSYSKDEAAFSRIGNQMAKHIGYRAGTIARTIYKTYGDLSTWEYVAHGTLAFAAELKDPGFSPGYSQVDSDWSDWKDNLLYLIDATGDPLGKHGPVKHFVDFAGL